MPKLKKNSIVGGETPGFSFQIDEGRVDIYFSAGPDPEVDSGEIKVATALLTTLYCEAPGIREIVEMAVLDYGGRVDNEDWALGFIEHLEHMGWHADNPGKDCDEDGMMPDEDEVAPSNISPANSGSRPNGWRGDSPPPAVRPISFDRYFKAGLD